MKKRSRLLAMLMALAMVLAYMPAMAFAEGEEVVSEDNTLTLEEGAEETIVENKEGITEAPLNELNAEAKAEGASWSAEAVDDYVYLNGSTATLEVSISGTVPEGGLFFEWYKDNGSQYVLIPGANQNTLPVSQNGYYSCTVYDEDDNYSEIDFSVYDNDSYQGVDIGGIWYELNTYNDADGAGAWGIENYSLAGNVSILSTVTLRNGKSYPVTIIDTRLPGAVTSVNIPASVVEIWGVGYAYETGDPVPGFTIFGTTGSAAQTYANQKGFIFRDLAVEAEAARQGTYVAGLPKVKISKPSAAKKSINVKWKKLTKKQLKKGVNKIEVWVCPNSAFGSGDTIIKFAGKKKASLKVKGLKKGTYFVKVRAIKYVGGVKYYTAWSKVKKVKIKK